MTKVLVTYKDNWADEFDIEGFTIIELESWNKFLANLTKLFKKELSKPLVTKWDTNSVEWNFGSNEAMNYESLDDLIDGIVVKDISDAEVASLIRLLNPYVLREHEVYVFGKFPFDADHYLVEEYLECTPSEPLLTE